MQVRKLYGPLKILSVVVLLLMASAMLYAFSMTLIHWTGISV
ncbi:hypothetical protein [Pseudomonas oligotrophica]|nr:hypothetical protein [Pseudomonas oligotrophica]